MSRLTGYFGRLGKIDYSYDNNGNRLSQAFAKNEQNKEVVERTETYSYSNNRMTAFKPWQDKPSDKYNYDVVGNIISVSSIRVDPTSGRTQNIFKLYEYNPFNQLTRFKETMRFADSPDSATITTDATYVYNGLQQRVSKTVNGATTLFLHDFDGNIIAEADGATGAITKEYIYTGSTRLAMVDKASGKIFNYVNGRHGTPQSLVDENNIPVWSAQYYPFGEAEIADNPVVEQNFRFPGQYYDKETGLHYNWHRYYDPSTGRYLTPDPIGLDGGMNLFVYAGANPVGFSDPRGLFSTFDAVYHYFVGGGSVSVNFAEVDAGLMPNDFPGYNASVKSMYRKEGTLSVDKKTSKDVGGWAGHITFRLNGKIQSNTCEWEFKGYIGAFNDKFDFNSMPWGARSYWKEIVTRMIGTLPIGAAYDINFSGNRQVTDGGLW